MPTPHELLAAAFARWAEPTATGDLLQVLDPAGRVLAETTYQVRSAEDHEGQLRFELDIAETSILHTGLATTVLIRCEGREMTWPVDQGAMRIHGEGAGHRLLLEGRFLRLEHFSIDEPA